MSAQNAHAHEDRLLDFAYGELPASEAQSLEQHVQGCARCSKALSDIRGVRSTMAHLSVEPPPDAGLESLLAYAQQSARRAAAGPEPKPSRWRRWLLPVVGLASVSTFGLLTLEVSKDVNLQPTLTQKAEPAAAKADRTRSYDDAPARPAAPAAMQAAPPPAPMEGALLDRAQRMQAEATVGTKGGGEGRPSDWMNAGSGGALLERRRGAESKKQMSGFSKSKSEAARDALSAPSAVMDDEAKDSALAQGSLVGSRSGLGVSNGIGNGGGGSDKLRKEEEGSLRLGGASYGRGLAKDDDELAEEAAPPPPADSVVAAAPMAPSTPPMPTGSMPTGSVQRNQQAPGKAMAAAEQMPATVSKPKSAPAEKAARADAMTTARDLSRQAQEAASQGDRARESQLLRAALAAGATGSERLSLLSRLCESEYAQGRRTEGAEVCARILSEAPDSEAAQRAGLWLGQGGAATVPVKKAPAQAAPLPSKQ
ncbi:zf-HC2 domain-containing protein [Corallococcus sp. bb12-1]|uniref:anti-sigma factor family protein n=1 Tax=Corallococcus sp. bb12-1 TaxID=2996784 RepID=UPI00227023A0|nr:zf-HC2 domain-containing protein [Corallococcus sp. bb12-1]MCY1042931.1 zf-HC2 domain-containing protein [Corallococcus sp. bb12-1]